MRRARFEGRRGPVAIAASALGAELELHEPKPFELRGSVAIVDIRGAVTQHATPDGFDSYDAIRDRFAAAVASPARAIVLRIDSPGGDVAGCFELSNDMRAMAAKAGKRLSAYADGMAASAGYALACAASDIWTSSAGAVGSIGVAHMLVDTTAMDRAMGLNFAVITSGARKADGNPHVGITDATIGVYQATVDSLAELFFRLVFEARSIPVAMVRGYEAGVFHGASARTAGLVDGVCTFDQLLETVSGPQAMAQAVLESTMKMAEIKAALVKAAEGDGDEAAEAKKMLAAMGDEKDGEDKADDDEKDKSEDEDGEKDKAEADDDEKDTAEADDEKKKEASVASALAEVNRLSAKVRELEKKDEATERKTLLASRQDFSPELIKILAKAPLAMVREHVATLPKTATGPRSTETTQATRSGSADDAHRLAPAESQKLAERMGLRVPKPTVGWDPHMKTTRVFPVLAGAPAGKKENV